MKAVASLGGFVLCALMAPYGLLWYPALLLIALASHRLLTRTGDRHRNDRIPDVADRGTTEIGEAWMLTSLLLRRSPSCSDRLHLCHVREAYLTELSVRDPDGFQRWVSDALDGDIRRPDLYIRREFREDDDAMNPWRRVLRNRLSRTHSTRG